MKRATKRDTCPYCEKNIGYMWVGVDMIREFFICPLCGEHVDISKRE